VTSRAAAAGPIRVVVAEDQVMVLGALAALLEMEADIAVVAQARDGREALEAVQTHKPDVLITDVEMPGLSGLDLARQLSGEQHLRIIVLTVFARAGYFRRAMVVRGLRVIDPELAAEAWSEPDPLTDRERQVLRLAGDGKTSAQIGALLGISDGTVRNYLSESIAKLGAANRVEAARLARLKGWL
jgi:two-component system response regulator DesR